MHFQINTEKTIETVILGTEAGFDYCSLCGLKVHTFTSFLQADSAHLHLDCLLTFEQAQSKVSLSSAIRLHNHYFRKKTKLYRLGVFIRVRIYICMYIDFRYLFTRQARTLVEGRERNSRRKRIDDKSSSQVYCVVGLPGR